MVMRIYVHVCMCRSCGYPAHQTMRTLYLCNDCNCTTATVLCSCADYSIEWEKESEENSGSHLHSVHYPPDAFVFVYVRTHRESESEKRACFNSIMFNVHLNKTNCKAYNFPFALSPNQRQPQHRFIKKRRKIVYN